MKFSSEDPTILSVFPEWQDIHFFRSNYPDDQSQSFETKVNATGEFMGRTEFCASVVNNDFTIATTKCMNAIVTRESRPIDKAFTYCVIVLVAIIYINMGAALDTDIIKQTMKRPIGPVIGFMAQFVIMPLVSITPRPFYS